MNDTREVIRAYILSEFLPGESAANLHDDTPLRGTGILDSLGTIRLMSFLERRFGIEISTREIGVDQFDRVQDIVSLVNGKRAATHDAS